MMWNWLGREDSNLRMTGSKPVALPLGDGPFSRWLFGLLRAADTIPEV